MEQAALAFLQSSVRRHGAGERMSMTWRMTPGDMADDTNVYGATYGAIWRAICARMSRDTDRYGA